MTKRPKPRPVGRPSLGDAAARERVEIRLTSVQRAQWQAAAELEGVTLKAWLVAAAELAIVRGSTR